MEESLIQFLKERELICPECNSLDPEKANCFLCGSIGRVSREKFGIHRLTMPPALSKSLISNFNDDFDRRTLELIKIACGR